MRPNPPAGTPRLLALRQKATEQERRRAASQLRQDRMRFMRGVIAVAVFVMLLGAGWLFGGHKFLGASSHRTGTQSEENRAGWIIRELGDGSRCRYQRFDNVTGHVGGGATAECEDVHPERKTNNPAAFSWGGR